MKKLKLVLKEPAAWIAIVGSISTIYTTIEPFIDPTLATKIVSIAALIYGIAKLYVKYTKSKKDDEFLEKVVESAVKKLKGN